MNEVLKHDYSLEKGDQADDEKVARRNRTRIETIPEDRRKRAFDEVTARFAPIGKDTHNYVDRDSGEVAFHDSGEKLSTQRNDPDVAVALVKMAEAKGWTDIKVNGHPDFRRAVWMEASLNGIEVRGFTPSDKDLFALEERRRQSMRNVVQRDELPGTDKTASAGTDKTANAGTGAVQERAAPVVARTKTTEGTLVEHGAAPYLNDEKNQPSYFVRVKNEKGTEHTSWGVDLRRAVEKSGAVSGDQVRLENKGNQEVTVKTAIRNQDGKITGYREKDVRRTQWNVEKTPGQNLTHAMALAVVKKNGIDPESPRGKQFLQAIDVEAAKRAEKGKLPKIPIRDIKAPTRMREADKTKPRPRRGTVKKEKEVQQTR
jgi:hypothetical protein